VHLLTEVRDCPAGLDADGGVLVPLVAGADVPGPLTTVMKRSFGWKCSLSFGSIDEARSLQVLDLF